MRASRQHASAAAASSWARPPAPRRISRSRATPILPTFRSRPSNKCLKATASISDATSNEGVHRMTSRHAFALLALLAATSPAAAQDWPTRPVKIVVPFGAGSTPDVVARLIADHLQKKLGQPFVIDNKPGASGNIGTDAVAKAKPDGETIGVSIGGPLAINTMLFSRLPYDPRKDIVAITQLVSLPSALTVNSNVKV